MTYPFTLDRFQLDAISALQQGRSVVVAAPTGSGKTVVAEEAVRLALADGTKAFYTTPIKALSNQKFHDLSGAHGDRNVGLLTGDNSIRAEAPVVVMTTEVLRNMLYAGSSALEGLSHVVLDEVHYLEDLYRGPVWEEVIIHLPPEVVLVCLSATVSNAPELAAWISTVRGPTELVSEHRRPVPLQHHYVVGEHGRSSLHVIPMLPKGRPNPRGAEFDARLHRGTRRRSSRQWRTPGWLEIVQLLAERDLLPGIYFLFSRQGCEDAAGACGRAGLTLTNDDERARIREIADEHTRAVGQAELAVLGHNGWLQRLQRGIAAHHAGMIPPFKEAVEQCFVEGLVKIVFATETLALGINMPARSVVIEKLTKFSGEGHGFLTPGQYSQLTGRAGRRGIDPVGHALVLWSPWVSFRQVSELARSREFVLRSAFRPSYNMAANLVRRHSPEGAHQVLRASFAQYQIDHRTDEMTAEAAGKRERAERLRQDLEEALGPGESLEDLLEEPDPDEARRRRRAVESAVRDLRPGDVVSLPGGVPVAVLSIAQRGPYSRIRYVDGEGRTGTVHSTALATTPEVLGRLNLPSPFIPQDRALQASLARQVGRRWPATVAGPEAPRRSPAHSRRLIRMARRLHRLLAEAREAEAAATAGRGSLEVQFDRILRVLEAWRYLEGWQLTDRGERLARVYHECDLLVTECLCRGLLDGLDAPGLAALVSTFTYEHRSPDEGVPAELPTPILARRFSSLIEVSSQLSRLEEDHELPLTRAPDPAFAPLAHAWASGADLARALGESEISGGDFVRNIKQLVDLLSQIALVCADPDTASAARTAASELRRGVVAASSLVAGAEAEASGT